MCDHECHYADLQKKGSNDIRAQAQESGRFLSYGDTGALSRLLDKQNLWALKRCKCSQKSRSLPLLKVGGLRWVTLHHPGSVSSMC